MALILRLPRTLSLLKPHGALLNPPPLPPRSHSDPRLEIVHGFFEMVSEPFLLCSSVCVIRLSTPVCLSPQDPRGEGQQQQWNIPLADEWRRTQRKTALLSLRFAPEAEIRHRTSVWGFQSRGEGAKGMERERKKNTVTSWGAGLLGTGFESW